MSCGCWWVWSWWLAGVVVVEWWLGVGVWVLGRVLVGYWFLCGGRVTGILCSLLGVHIVPLLWVSGCLLGGVLVLVAARWRGVQSEY